ncbi:MAG: UDP-N-acetyl-D-mannosamine dehydrogenase [Bdellovibrionales bacterium]|nr:UDP-N-acetyl-D-mannosamine dehydrogenase [Bdellovibrionales bacterium]
MNSQRKKICVIGMGYIGLPTSALLASSGYQVYGIDINFSVVESINKGKTHFIEPDLDGLVHKMVMEKKLLALLEPTAADVFLIAVPTPFKNNFEPDLSFVEAAIDSISPCLKNNDLVILESTSPVGTTQLMYKRILENRPDVKNIYMSYCPERVLPGKILKELKSNDRVVGGIDVESATITSQFYKTFVDGGVRVTTSETAELVKLAENSFRDVNIAFANELGRISDSYNINIWELINLANLHPRVNILNPGPGVGGHCIAVDPWFIVHSAKDNAKLIRTSREINDSQPLYVLGKIRPSLEEASIKKMDVVVYGLAFKANIDDLRESPAVEIVKAISKEFDGNIYVVEPNIHELPKELSIIENVKFVAELEQLSGEFSLGVILVAHDEFKNKLDLIKNQSNEIIDVVGVCN